MKAWQALFIVISLFQKLLGLRMGLRHFVILDSSTEKKWSTHVIAHFPGGLTFEDPRHVGTFIALLIDFIHQVCCVKLVAAVALH